MSAATRNVVALVVLVMGLAFAGFRYSLHCAKLEAYAAAQANEAKLARERAFSLRCRGLGGKELFGFPGLCVKQDAVLEVMP